MTHAVTDSCIRCKCTNRVENKPFTLELPS